VVDAWRIESADDGEEQGLLASAYQFSYRVALLATDSVILIVAATVGWRMAYGIYGACMAVGMIATWFAKEPGRADAVMDAKEREAPLWTPRGFFDAVVGPFIAFFRAHGWLALVMLAAISLYRLPDFIMGPMANPYYHEANSRSGAWLNRTHRYVRRHRSGRNLFAEAWLHARAHHRGYCAGSCDRRVCDSRVRGHEHSSLRAGHGR